MSYDNKDSFVLFRNDRKEKDNQPDYTGKITLPDGTERRLAAWLKEGKSGKVFSGKVSDYQQPKDYLEQKPEPAPQAQPEFDDIPF